MLELVVYNKYVATGRNLAKRGMIPYRTNNILKEIVKLNRMRDEFGERLFPHLQDLEILPPYPDWEKSFFIYYPTRVENKPEYYEELRGFMFACKAKQREILSNYVCVPNIDNGPPYVVRPVKHHKGIHYYIADTQEEIEGLARKLGNVYYSSVFPKEYEYRIIFVRGRDVIRIVKKWDGEPHEAVNHENGARFITVARGKVPRLYNRTPFVEDAKSFLADYPFDFVAFDVGLCGDDYVVFEVNFAPQMDIENNIEVLYNAATEPR